MGSGGSIILVAGMCCSLSSGLPAKRFSTTARLPLRSGVIFGNGTCSTRPAHRRVDDARDQRVRAYAAVLELGRPSPGVRTQRRLAGGVGRVVRQAHVVHGRGWTRPRLSCPSPPDGASDAVEVLKLGRVRLDGVGANELHRLIERFRATDVS